jgi:hypothetical protein
MRTWNACKRGGSSGAVQATCSAGSRAGSSTPSWFAPTCLSNAGPKDCALATSLAHQSSRLKRGIGLLWLFGSTFMHSVAPLPPAPSGYGGSARMAARVSGESIARLGGGGKRRERMEKRGTRRVVSGVEGCWKELCLNCSAEDSLFAFAYLYNPLHLLFMWVTFCTAASLPIHVTGL